MKRMISLLVVILMTSLQLEAAIVTLTPGPGLNDGSDTGTATTGKDTGYANGTYTGGEPVHWISNPTWAGPGRAYFQFDVLSETGPGAVISSANLTLTNRFALSPSFSAWPRSEVLELSVINGAWSENSVAGLLPTTFFDSQIVDPNTAWSIIPDPLGGSGTTLVGTVTYDVTSLVQGWVDNPSSNFGVAYGIGGSAYPYNTIDPFVFTSDAVGAALSMRPSLEITFVTIPEPSSAMLTALAFTLFGFRRARRV